MLLQMTFQSCFAFFRDIQPQLITGVHRFARLVHSGLEDKGISDNFTFGLQKQCIKCYFLIVFIVFLVGLDLPHIVGGHSLDKSATVEGYLWASGPLRMSRERLGS